MPMITGGIMTLLVAGELARRRDGAGRRHEPPCWLIAIVSTGFAKVTAASAGRRAQNTGGADGQVWTSSVEARGVGNAPQEEGDAEERIGAQGREQEAGDRNRLERGARERREGARTKDGAEDFPEDLAKNIGSGQAQELRHADIGQEEVARGSDDS
jgi:hypothetical protein